MNPVLVIFNDTPAFREQDFIEKINGRGGNHKEELNGRTIICLSDLNGFEDLVNHPGVKITSYEEVFGYDRQKAVDGIPQYGPSYTVTPPLRQVWVEDWIEISPDVWEDQGEYIEVQDPDYITKDPIMESIDPIPASTALYNSVYVKTPPDDFPKLMGIPAGYDMRHLNL